jgi:5-methylcytosine-specific restriction protein A
LTDEGSRCPAHLAEARRADEERRPRSERRYGETFERNREILLKPKPLCACGCGRIADTADHWPVSRRDLIAQGVPDPDALHRLRPLYHVCHARKSGGERRGAGAAPASQSERRRTYRVGSPGLR